MDTGDLIKYIILFFVGTFAAGTIVYVVAYCFVRGAFAAFVRSIFDQNKTNTKDQYKKGE